MPAPPARRLPPAAAPLYFGGAPLVTTPPPPPPLIRAPHVQNARTNAIAEQPRFDLHADDHVHIRLNSGPDNEWKQISVTRGTLESVLPSGTRLHVHAPKEDGNKGCTATLIDAIPTEIWPEAVAADEAASDEVCAVCYDNFSAGDRLAVLPCAHRYHLDCVRPWLLKNNTCPACRTEVTETSLGEEPEAVAGGVAAGEVQLPGSPQMPPSASEPSHLQGPAAHSSSAGTVSQLAVLGQSYQNPTWGAAHAADQPQAPGVLQRLKVGFSCFGLLRRRR